MTDDGLLSQEEIDALMAGLSNDDSGDNAGGSNEGGGSGGGNSGNDGNDQVDIGSTGDLPDSLDPFLKIVGEQTESVVTTIVNRSVDIRFTQTRKADEAFGEESERELVLTSGFEGDLDGKLFFLVSKKITALLADLMMMGDGNAGFEEDHKDALTELGNQVMGALVTHLGSEMQISVNTLQAETGNFSPDHPPIDPDSAWVAEYSVQIEGFDPANIELLISDEFAQSISSSTNIQSAEDNQEIISQDGNPVSTGYMEADQGSELQIAGGPNIEMLLDIPLNVTIELGKAMLSIRKILELGPGSILELDRLAGEPVDLLVNDKVVAKGEVVVIDEFFGIRILSLLSPEDRIKQLK